MSAEGCPADPRAAMAWIDREEAEVAELAELAAEIAVDGFPAVFVRRADQVLGAPPPPVFLEVGDGTVIEGPPGAGGGGLP
jgi:anti-sigma factor RsiW